MTEQQENQNRTSVLPVLLSALGICSLVLFSTVSESTSFQARTAAIAASRQNWENPEIKAQAYLVKILGENTVLAKQREWKKMAPASLTKLFTAVLALDEITPFTRIALSGEAKKIEPKVSPVGEGESLTRDDMLKLALVGSANDIAFGLAEVIGLEKIRDLAKAKIAQIGLFNSSFANPAGLDEPEQYTTAEDLAKLAEYIYQRYPVIWEFSTLPEAEIYSERGNKYIMKNTNILLKEFPAILGSKTGFTENAGESLLMLYPVRGQTSNGIYPVRPDKIAVIVILKSSDRFGDGRKIINWLESIKLVPSD